MRVVSGIQPTGNLHLGNYLGAILRWVRMQDEAECLFFLADLHALTVYNDPAELAAQRARDGGGADRLRDRSRAKSTLFNTARVPAHPELAWILNCTARIGWLNRMTQFKEKSGKNREGASVGLFAYPVLQAADVLLYQATHVPVGEDQKQHIELIRDIATKFNTDYDVELFVPCPSRFIGGGAAARIMSLRDGSAKMSKSDPSDMSRINLTDDDDTVAQKIRKAKTDPSRCPTMDARSTAAGGEEPRHHLCGARRPERAPQAVLARFAGQGFGAFKPALGRLAQGGGLEFSRYAALVAQQMQAQGYAQAASPQQATMIVQLGYNVDQGTERRVVDRFGPRSYDPFYRGFYSPYGIYGSRFDPRFGVYYGRPYYSRFGYYGAYRSPFYYGWDDPFWFGGADVREYTEYKSELDLDIRRRADNQQLFDGRAQARSTTDNTQVLVPNLIQARSIRLAASSRMSTTSLSSSSFQPSCATRLRSAAMRLPTARPISGRLVIAAARSRFPPAARTAARPLLRSARWARPSSVTAKLSCARPRPAAPRSGPCPAAGQRRIDHARARRVVAVGQLLRAAGRPAAAGAARRGRRAGASDRPRRRDRPDGRGGQARLDDPVGAARHRQDHHRAAARRRGRHALRRDLGGLLRRRRPQEGVRRSRDHARRGSAPCCSWTRSTASTAPAGRLPALCRGRHGGAGRRHHREPQLRAQRRACCRAARC
jgi:tryptophanyl-tRNA synthetase